jgi:hypothetical protein
LTWTEDNVTARATTLAAGDRLPLFFGACGKAERVERSQFGDIAPHRDFHSPSLWMTKKTFKKYRDLFHDHHPDGSELELLVDSDSAHQTRNVKQTAARFEIERYFIPQVVTHPFQPLDRKVFGVLKRYTKRLFLERPPETHNSPTQKVMPFMPEKD